VTRISLVTASYNQGRFLRRTIDSVLAQNDPDLEHIVVDGMSADDTPGVLARYPHLKVVREPDRGQADAVNKGFRLATGDVFGFLNSDDTLEPGALARVRRELDPARGRHVVVGRCRFVDEDDRFTGREHPSAFAGHRRVLEVWKGHTIPQPATFWTREVWRRCGPLDEGEPLVLDYDLFCRVSKCYTFHPVDQVLANYRLHPASKTCSAADDRVLAESLRVSRRYWGPWTSPLRWRLEASYLSHRLARCERALAWWQGGRDDLRRRRRLRGLLRLGGFAVLAPDLLASLALWPALQRLAPGPFERWGLARRFRPRRPPAQTRAWLGFTGRHEDGWVGPRYAARVAVPAGPARLRLEVAVDAGHLPEPLELELYLGRRRLDRLRVGRRTPFAAAVDLAGVPPGEHELTIVSNTYVTHHAIRGNEDYRPLSFQLRRLELAERPPAA
jgi:glycosyltransferase involved in cell wall biosynthesis